MGSAAEPESRPHEPEEWDQPEPATSEQRAPLTTPEWRASPGSGTAIGGTLAFLLLVLDLYLALRVAGSAGWARAGWIVAAAAVAAGAARVAWLTYGLSTMRYVLNRDHMRIECMGERHIVRYSEMLDVTYQPREPVRFTGWEPHWPGFYVSSMRAVDGIWHSWATQAPQRRVRITTTRAVIAISPRRPVMFVEELKHRRLAYPALPVDTTTVAQSDIASIDEAGGLELPVRMPAPRTGAARAPGFGYAWNVLFRRQLLGDQMSSTMLAVGVILPFLMAGYLYSQYEGIPERIAFHWNAHGEIDKIGRPRDVWIVPIMAGLVLVANTALATFLELFDRFLSRLLLAATPAFQVMAFIAMLRLINAG